MTETGAIVFQFLSIISLGFLFFLEVIKKELSKGSLTSLRLAALMVILIYVSNV
ncbi:MULTISPECIES: hypothetical protein [Clostridium]|uniref:hypothetical protein n=1 Tax=Clostridium TaxID=1485 RepID=UPI0028FEF96A|nr:MULTISPECIES: hypothetical protein [Clostridium]MDM0678279.1 hypothetical protein [Clostridium perfringens]MDM0722945.1 hypothetical protein [Clostridium perfringens]MDM0726047.1 hypothetical protein [Clostridium perfringens]MDU2284095.1 hypothetical protein [Clostridium sp.]MDU3600365.1 hypothetical protein [Clostridium perfringens]